MSLSPDEWARVKRVFDAAVALDAGERPGYLARACGDDAALRRQVETMLAAHDGAPAFLETPAAVLLDGPPAPDDLIGETIGPYRLVARIGAGGMGEVYKAEDARLHRPVAVKLLPPHLATDADRLRRFHAEARAASSLNHPHILVIHDFGEVDGRPFIVTEFVEGQTVRQRLQTGPIPPREAVDIAVQIASALTAAHARGLVHRDIKPENVMLRPDGYVKVLDFGLAKLTATMGSPPTTQTLAGTVMGTPRYMSPEQARGLEVDERSDIWSLGIVLYEMVAGCAPFDGATPTDVMAAVVRSEPLPLEQAAPGTSAALGAVVKQALTKGAGLRFASAFDMQKALAAARASLDPAGPSTIESPTPACSPALRPQVTSTPPSIAILPFADMSSERDQDYFCEGIAEELINALTALPGLRVSSRTSAFRFKQPSADLTRIGRQLDVECVLEGSVRKTGSRLRITARLVRVFDGSPIWSERYDRDLDDVLGIQEEIARMIVAKLRVTLPGSDSMPVVRQSTHNAEAYDLYLRGRFHWSQFAPGSPRQAIACFEQAIARDPHYALAYAGIAHVYSSLALYYFIPQAIAQQKTLDAAMRGVELGPDFVEPHAALGWARLLFRQDAVEAERQFRAAIDLNDHNIYGHYYLGVLDVGRGRFADGLARLQRVCATDPLYVPFQVTLAVGFRLAGQVERAVDICARALELDDRSPVALWHYGLSLSLAGRAEEAVGVCERAVDRSSRNLFALAALAQVSTRAGHEDRARAVLDEIRTRAKTGPVPSMAIGWVYAALQERDAALDALERACDEHDVQLWWMKHDQVFAPLRGDQRFNAILARVYGTAAGC